MASKQFKASIVLGGVVASSLKAAFGSTEGGLKRVGAQITALTNRQKLLSTSIQTFGRMGKNVSALRANYASVTAQVDRLTAAQKRLIAAQERSTKFKAAAGKVAGAGVVAGALGAVGTAGIMSTVSEASKYATESSRVRALGLDKKTTAMAIDFSQRMKTFGTSQLDNLTLMRDSLSVFGDLHHAEIATPVLARMKFANEAMFGKEKGGENEQQFMDMLKVIELRGGAQNEDSFRKQSNMVQKVISATGGRVGGSEWRNLISTGGLAAKGMRDDAFFYQLEGLVQEMGGDKVGTGLSASYSSLYQGRTSKRAMNNLQKYGLIADPSKVIHDKVGQISQLNPGALKGAELFRQSQYEWMKQVLIPTLASKGVTTKDQVLDAIGALVSNKKGADLLAAMYLQQGQIDKNERVNRGAYDVDQLDKEARNTPDGRRLELEARVHDLKLQLGKDVLPLYARGLELASGALQRLNGFVERHPRLAKAMVVTVAAVSGGLLVLAPVLATVGGLLSAYAGYTVLMGRFGLASAASAGQLGFFAKSVRFVGVALRWVGTTILSNPIFLAASAIALAAVEIYRHWDGIKAFFGRLWGDIKQVFGGQMDIIVGLITFDLDRIKKGFHEVFDGVQSYVDHVFSGIASGIATIVSDALEAMGIIDQKKRELEVGKDRAAAEAKDREKSLDTGARAVMKTGGTPLALPVLYALWQNHRKLADANDAAAAKEKAGAATVPPMAAAGQGDSSTIVHQQNDIKIIQQPGQDSKALARDVAAELKRTDGVQRRGQLIDGH